SQSSRQVLSQASTRRFGCWSSSATLKTVDGIGNGEGPSAKALPPSSGKTHTRRRERIGSHAFEDRSGLGLAVKATEFALPTSGKALDEVASVAGGDRGLRSRCRRNSIDDVIAAVDVERLARDQPRPVHAQEGNRDPHIIDGDEAAAWRLRLRFLQEFV